MAINQSVTARQTQPHALESADATTSAATDLVKPTQKDFGASALRVGNASGAMSTTNTDPVRVQEHQGAAVFSKGFSKNFARAHADALEALRSPENLQSFRDTGQLSPAAGKAVYRLVSIVALKSSDDHASVAARWAYREDKLTPAEMSAWMNFLNRLPASFTSANAPSAAWKPVTEAELSKVLAQDNAFAQFIHEPEGRRFVAELTDAMNTKSTAMQFSDKGMAFTMQFAHAYLATNHIAGGSFWRDAEGKLQMAIIHQESYSPTKETGGIAVGRVYPYLDTQSDHPQKLATMVESIKLNGMPTVNLFPCPAPEKLVLFTQLLSAVGNHPYGPTEDWNNNKRGNLPKERAFECCFDVTIRALYVMHDLMAERVHLLPDNLDRMRDLASIPSGRFDTVTIPVKGGKKDVKIADMRSLKFEDQYAVFKEVGQAWGRDTPWDVNKQTSSEIRSLAIQPGQQGITVEPGQRFKFIDKIEGLTLDGAPVRREKAYTAEEGLRMVYAGNTPAKSVIAVTKPIAGTRAKL